VTKIHDALDQETTNLKRPTHRKHSTISARKSNQKPPLILNFIAKRLTEKKSKPPADPGIVEADAKTKTETEATIKGEPVKKRRRKGEIEKTEEEREGEPIVEAKPKPKAKAKAKAADPASAPKNTRRRKKRPSLAAFLVSPSSKT